MSAKLLITTYTAQSRTDKESNDWIGWGRMYTTCSDSLFYGVGIPWGDLAEMLPKVPKWVITAYITHFWAELDD